MRSILISLLIFTTALPASAIGVFDEPAASQECVAGGIPTTKKKSEEVAENYTSKPQKKTVKTAAKQLETPCEHPCEARCEPVVICCDPPKINYFLPALVLAGGGGAAAYYITYKDDIDPYVQTPPPPPPPPPDVLLQFRVTIQAADSFTVPITVTGPDTSLPFILNYSYTAEEEESVLVPTTALVNAPNGTYTVDADISGSPEATIFMEMLVDGVVVEGPEFGTNINFNYTGTP